MANEHQSLEGPSPQNNAAGHGRFRRVLRNLFRIGAGCLGCLICAFLVASAVVSRAYDISFREAGHAVGTFCARRLIDTGVSIWDPCSPVVAVLGPDPSDYPPLDEFVRAEEFLEHNEAVARGWSEARIDNPRIIRSRHPFGYQPYAEPRLHELRERYRLAEIMRKGGSEFEQMVILRGWARTRFRRQDYQPQMQAFDALTILDRDFRNDDDTSLDKSKSYDPCQFFPLLYCQVLASVGHTGRYVNDHHGHAEVWSNQYAKWVLMDAELNAHYEKDGVPLNMFELHELRGRVKEAGVRVVQTEQSSGDSSTTMVHLKIPKLEPDSLFGPGQSGTFQISSMRNDWMTNHYFRGHPARSTRNSLIYDPPGSLPPITFVEARRPRTNRVDDLYWTLNQAEILVRKNSSRDRLLLAFKTVTPNFDHFEVTVDQARPRSLAMPTFEWALHEGLNSLTVRSANQFGIRGPQSQVVLRLLQHPESTK